MNESAPFRNKIRCHDVAGGGIDSPTSEFPVDCSAN